MIDAAHLEAKFPDGVRAVIDTRYRVPAPRLSLIVPAFNVEDYIESCLQSILISASAVHSQVELIVVDDGSSDHTLQRAFMRLEKVDDFGVLLLSQSNLGLSAVRNFGASLARGIWMGFLDSDDTLAPLGFSRLWASSHAPSVDLILGASQLMGPEGALRPFYHAPIWSRFFVTEPQRRVSLQDVPEMLALEPNVNYRWIRKSFYLASNLHFPEGLYFEDIPIHFRMLRLASAVVLVNETYYLYRIGRPGKITETRSHRPFDALKTLSMSIEELQKSGMEPKQVASGLRVIDRLSWGCGRMTFPERRLEYFLQLTEVHRAIPRSLRFRYFFGVCRDSSHFLLGVLLFLKSPGLLLWASALSDFRRWLRDRLPQDRKAQ